MRSALLVLAFSVCACSAQEPASEARGELEAPPAAAEALAEPEPVPRQPEAAARPPEPAARQPEPVRREPDAAVEKRQSAAAKGASVTDQLRARNESSETVEICFFRVDRTPEEQLHCVADVGEGAIATHEVTLAGVGRDGAEIRAYATNAAGIRSGPSNPHVVVRSAGS